MKKQELTQELLKELLDYDPLTGVFTWRERYIKWFKSESYCNFWNKRFANKEAGSIAKTNRMTWKQIKIFEKAYTCHFLAFLYVNGRKPNHVLDCIDGDYTNVKISNIRECTRTDTHFKIKESIQENELIGAYFHKTTGKYQSSIGVNGDSIYLGLFNTPEEAHAAYVEAKRQISPEFSML